MTVPHADQPIVVSGAPRGAADAGVVLLHGRGATAQGVTNLAAPLYRHGVTFFAPEAERSRWYPYAFDQPRERNEPHLSGALARVDAALSRARDAGLPAERVLLFGFSQGACLACEYAARHPRRFGGVVALSGGLLGPVIQSDEHAGSLEDTPVFLGVGADDDRVPVARVRDTAEAFEALDADVTTTVYDGVGHEVTDDEFDRANALLNGILAG
ncbi:alpha/beta hydrolase [Salarchaeum japonicum]|uniref:Dienelactone hydrolase family protein n=1 Tax=Salarchaeum japonicum TaxID=555573 RepID=A0AAV3T2S7_9EURY|nr:alpha/beta fold hydrolase [Salarchaeum japonicum]